MVCVPDQQMGKNRRMREILTRLDRHNPERSDIVQQTHFQAKTWVCITAREYSITFLITLILASMESHVIIHRLSTSRQTHRLRALKHHQCTTPRMGTHTRQTPWSIGKARKSMITPQERMGWLVNLIHTIECKCNSPSITHLNNIIRTTRQVLFIPVLLNMLPTTAQTSLPRRWVQPLAAVVLIFPRHPNIVKRVIRATTPHRRAMQQRTRNISRLRIKLIRQAHNILSQSTMQRPIADIIVCTIWMEKLTLFLECMPTHHRQTCQWEPKETTGWEWQWVNLWRSKYLPQWVPPGNPRLFYVQDSAIHGRISYTILALIVFTILLLLCVPITSGRRGQRRRGLWLHLFNFIIS